MKVTLAVWIIAIAFCAPVSGEAANNDRQDARAKFNEGIKAFTEQQYDIAVGLFREAYGLSPTWKLLYNIGQCEAALKRYGLAIDAFEEYLAQGGDEVPEDKRTFILDELDKMRKMVGSLQIKAADNLEIWIDGIYRNTTPLRDPIIVTAGIQHTIILKRDGQEFHKIKRKVRGGMAATVDLDTPGGGPEKPEESDLSTDIPLEPTLPVSDRSSDGISPVFFWTGLATTVAAGGATLGLVFAVNGRKDNLTSQSGLDTAESMQAAGIALLCVTGAAAIATAALAIFTDFKKEDDQLEQSGLSWGVFHQRDTAGLTVGGTF